VRVERDGADLRVIGAGGAFPATTAAVDCREAGTAARFLAAAAAGGAGTYRFDAAPQLRRRPMGPLLEALRAQGVVIEPSAAQTLPFTLRTRGLAGGQLRLPGDVSSQFVSALLMAAPLGVAPLELRVAGLVSRPYVTMTLRMMAQFGITATEADAAVAPSKRRASTATVASNRFTIAPGRYVARDYAVEPDASTASYFFAAAAVAGRVQVLGLHRTEALQGDVAFLDVLEAMGCHIEDAPEGVRVSGPSQSLSSSRPSSSQSSANRRAALNGISVDMSDIPDTFMTLAAIAPLATSPVTISGLGNVRLKESDRLAAMETNLNRMGIRTESGHDWLRIQPGTPHSAVVDPHNDHRIAMAFSVLGLRVPGIVIANPQCVSKTCPPFFTLWSTLESATSG